MFKYLFILSFFTLQLYANDFRTVAPDKMAWNSAKEGKWCALCGMNLQKFYKTAHVHTHNHQKTHFCSLHCLVDHQNSVGKNGVVQVVDAKTLKLIDAKSAHYVVGSNKPGTMSMVSKYAFAKKVDAQAFQKQFGGKVMSYADAYSLAKKSLGKEKQMISMKRGRKLFPMGKKIYMHKCDQKKLQGLEKLDVAKIKMRLMKDKICGSLEPMQLQMVSVYIKYGVEKSFTVPKEAKCPVCGMFVAKYPKWAVVLEAKGKKLYFDGLKDFFKFYLKQPQGKSLAKDFYTMKDLDLKSAYMVSGSNIFGPMGHELIPFAVEKDAKNFMKEHRGKKIYRFNQVTAKVIQSLDE